MTMNQMVSHIKAETGLNDATVKAVLCIFLECIRQSCIKGTSVKIKDFGVFEIRERKTRYCVNPQNKKERLLVEGYQIPYFRPSKKFKEAVKTTPKDSVKHFIEKR